VKKGSRGRKKKTHKTKTTQPKTPRPKGETRKRQAKGAEESSKEMDREGGMLVKNRGSQKIVRNLEKLRKTKIPNLAWESFKISKRGWGGKRHPVS